MQIEHVVSVLESLAHGIDPTTDTELTHPLFTSPDVIRALFTAATLLQTPARNRPPAAGARWTDDEDAEVTREYDDGITFSEMAQKHGRTTGAIMARLIKLGRIDPNTLAPRLRERPTLVSALEAGRDN